MRGGFQSKRTDQQTGDNPSTGSQHADPAKFNLRITHLPKGKRIGKCHRRHITKAIKQDDAVKRRKPSLLRGQQQEHSSCQMQHTQDLFGSEKLIGHDPTKKGAMIAPTAVAPATMPTCCPLKCSVLESQVATVTYHAPQIKYSRNIMAPRRILICNVMRGELLPASRGPARHSDWTESSGHSET